MIKDLDGADVFLHNRANSLKAPLNEYDIEEMLDIAKICDKAARTLEKAIIPPCNVGQTIYYICCGKIFKGECHAITIHKDSIQVHLYDFDGDNASYSSKDVYTSREEAQAELESLTKALDIYAVGKMKQSDIGFIEHLNEEVDKIKRHVCHNEAIKEFAEGLKDIICKNVNRSLDNTNGYNYYPIDVYEDIDNLVKEMTEGEK